MGPCLSVNESKLARVAPSWNLAAWSIWEAYDAMCSVGILALAITRVVRKANNDEITVTEVTLSRSPHLLLSRSIAREIPAYTMASPRSVAVAIIFASPSPPRDTAAAPDSHAIAPYNDDKDDKGPTFLLVSSRKKKNRYVFPKGGIEHGERSPEAAERESWEEGAAAAPTVFCCHRGATADPYPMRYVSQPDCDPEPQDT